MINSVEMVNWRAYDRRKICFGPGITFLMGPNGIGKTSILEAIAYALTGEPSTVKQRGKMLRNPDKLATVSLSFTIDSQTYLVERSQSFKRADQAKLTREGERKALASTHKQVTAQIEELVGVSADFLQRIVYMAEGDVFRFLDQPPGDALDLQIRQVLGLTQLDEFVRALDLTEKEMKGRITSLQQVLGLLEQLDVRQNVDLEQHMQEMDTRREQLLHQLRSVQDEITRYRRENEDLLRLKLLIEKALPTLDRDPDTRHAAQRMPLLALFEQLDSESQEAQSIAQECQMSLAHLQGEQSAHQRIVDILGPYAGRAETLPCPVCSKPMTSNEREVILNEIQANMSHTIDEMKEIDLRRSRAEQAANRSRMQLENLRELRNNLTHVHFQSIDSGATLANLVDVTRLQQAGVLPKLQERASALERQISELESEKAEYLSAQRRLQNLDCASPEEASESLVGLEIRSLSLRAASRAAQDTLTTQRNTDMEAIYAQVARVWEAFLGKDGWSVQLDGNGMPLLQDDKGRKFDLSYFSGGEKTALLVMLHTIIAHHFSKSDFLLIDEPLEHLDAVNRRSLIRFLVGAYRRNSFKQAIIATFEESLIRKYTSEEGIHVIHI